MFCHLPVAEADILRMNNCDHVAHKKCTLPARMQWYAGVRELDRMRNLGHDVPWAKPFRCGSCPARFQVAKNPVWVRDQNEGTRLVRCCDK